MNTALVSVHDVMPETLGEVSAVVGSLEARGLAPVTLLIVPGCGWTSPAIERLRHWQRAGHQLAGHGWSHRAERPRRLRHRLHAAFVSRACGEHLALTAAEILALMSRSHRWFAEQDLTAPELYVPPAWVLGPIDRAALKDQPFEHVETLKGVYDVAAKRFRRLPLIGFEADTASRAVALRLWNRTAGRGENPRVAIHPADPRLRLRADLEQALERITSTRTYAQWRRKATP